MSFQFRDGKPELWFNKSKIFVTVGLIVVLLAGYAWLESVARPSSGLSGAEFDSRQNEEQRQGADAQVEQGKF